MPGRRPDGRPDEEPGRGAVAWTRVDGNGDGGRRGLDVLECDVVSVPLLGWVNAREAVGPPERVDHA
ncbi:hypothetical protein ACLQ18_25940 [Streptomyces sp. DT193]|uniref:hypothetical protein n=1 Tax=Streptomyces sp. DT193 TaxID=3393418 RepID=UPI003CF047BB